MENSKTLDLTKLEVAQDESCKALQYLVHEKWRANGKKCSERMDVISYLRDGFPFEAVKNVLDNTCISRKELSGILHVSTRQLNRYGHDDRLSAEQSGFFYEFSRVYCKGPRHFRRGGNFQELAGKAANGLRRAVAFVVARYYGRFPDGK